MKPSWCQAKTGPLEGVGPRSACGDPSFHLFLHSHLSCSCFSRATLPPFLLLCSGVRMMVHLCLYFSGNHDEYWWWIRSVNMVFADSVGPAPSGFGHGNPWGCDLPPSPTWLRSRGQRCNEVLAR